MWKSEDEINVSTCRPRGGMKWSEIVTLYLEVQGLVRRVLEEEHVVFTAITIMHLYIERSI